MPLHELSDLDIEAYYKHNKSFGGCFSKDRAFELKDNHFYILNMDHPSGPGTHWILVYLLNPKVGIYFDSFGAPPPTTILSYMRKHRAINYRNICDFQSLYSSSCGWFCIYVTDNLLNGRSFDSIERDFSTNIRANEALLRKYFKR